MGLNCQQGDLAFIIRSPNGANLGKVVKCISLVETKTRIQIADHHFVIIMPEYQCWQIDQEIAYSLRGKVVGRIPYICDKYLKPIRPKGGQIEDLRKEDLEIKKIFDRIQRV